MNEILHVCTISCNKYSKFYQRKCERRESELKNEGINAPMIEPKATWQGGRKKSLHLQVSSTKCLHE